MGAAMRGASEAVPRADVPLSKPYIRPKISGMLRGWSLWIVVVCALLAGCNINRDIMFKTPLDHDFDQLPDTLPQAFRIQANDIITFRLFANDGFRMIDLVDDNNQGQRNLRTVFNYTVDADGRAKLPLLGLVPLTGLSIREAELKLEGLYTEFYNRPFVQLFINNRRVVVFPGGGGDAKIIPLENTNTTIMEAIASAGGLNKRADARKIKLFRKNPDGGPRKEYLFDMSDIKGLPYADLTVQADDIIYVQPNPEIAREILSDLNPIIALLTSTVLVIGIVRGFSQ